MATIPVINSTTAAAAKVAFNTGSYHETVVAHAFGLAGSETVAVFIGGSGGWTVATDSSGDPLVMTAGAPQVSLTAGPLYAFDKSASAAPSGLDVSVSQ